MKQRVSLQPAYVLHTRPFRDSSLIAEVFSARYGRTSILARGIKRPRSRIRGLVQPFQPLLVAAEVDGPITWLNGKSIITAFYVNELLLRLVRRFDPMPDLFQHYNRVMHYLISETDKPSGEQNHNDGPTLVVEQQVRYFEKNLLQELGYGLNLSSEAGSREAIKPEACYLYQFDQGARLLDQPGRDLPAGTVLHGRTLLELTAERLSDSRSLREAKQLLRGALGTQLGDKPLASREIYRDLVDKERLQAGAR